MRLICFFDGSCSQPRSGGLAAYGYVIKDESGETLHAASGRVGRGLTSDSAEYEGLYQAMLYVHKHHPDAEVVFNGDSTLVISQMKGESKVKKGKYLPFYRKAIALATPYIERKQWTFQWVQRSFNSEADKLAAYRF